MREQAYSGKSITLSQAVSYFSQGLENVLEEDPYHHRSPRETSSRVFLKSATILGILYILKRT
jgi:type II secretory ATPase GspE/PulE/Tfp pilus assembly ATPase PilB-like protein